MWSDRHRSGPTAGRCRGSRPRKQPAYAGTSRPCARHSPASRWPASARMRHRDRGAERVGDARDARTTAPTSGAASSACSWIEEVRAPVAGDAEQVRGHRRRQRRPEHPREDERAPAPRPAAPAPGVSTAPRSAASSAPCAPAATASMPAPATSGVAWAAVAHRTSWPAARNAWASWSIGMTWPWPDVEENRTLTTAGLRPMT